METYEPIEKIVETVRAKFEKIGLYLTDYEIGTTDAEAAMAGANIDWRKTLAEGNATWVLQSLFSIGEVAYSERIQDPDAVKQTDEFKIIAPTEEELFRDKLLREGLSAFEQEEEDN